MNYNFTLTLCLKDSTTVKVGQVSEWSMVQSWKDCVVLSHREFESLPVRHLIQTPRRFRVINQNLKPIQVSKQNRTLPPQSWTKVGHVQAGFLTVSDVAEKINVSVKTVTRWCESGKLAAVPKRYGQKVTYQISQQAVDMLLLRQKEEQRRLDSPTKPHEKFFNAWVRALNKGIMTGKPLSPLTIEYYTAHAQCFFLKHDALTPQAVRIELMRCQSQQYAKRSKIHKAMVSYAKFLVMQRVLDSSVVDELKTLRPKRHLPPKRLVLESGEIQKLFSECESPSDKLIVILLSQTGLRASEFCALQWNDIDFEKQTLLVRVGKGNKSRCIGLGKSVIQALKVYQAVSRKENGALFLDPKGYPMSRHGLYKRLQRLGKKAGVEVSPHALRRAFVTINANAGRPLQMIQRACGHSDIKTTMAYCRTSEQEVIDAMKDW